MLIGFTFLRLQPRNDDALPFWWRQPRIITVVVDNPSWILPYAERLASDLVAAGDRASLVFGYKDMPEGTVAFFLGCTGIATRDILAKHRRNLVVHESALPQGRGFSPLTWQILERKRLIPICLIEAVDEVDAGPVIYRETMSFEGHELIDDMRDVVGRTTAELCRRFLREAFPPTGHPQMGTPTYYPRRRPADSRLDPTLPLTAQFELLRVVDNVAYPAWFEYRGQRYKLSIEKLTK